MLGTLYGLRSISYASTSWTKMYKIGAISPLEVWHNSPVKLSGPHTFCFGRLLIIDLISLIHTSLLKLFVSCVNFGRL